MRSTDRVIYYADGTIHSRRGGKILKLYRRDTGYLHTGVGRGRFRRVHQLVLEAHVGPAPDGLVACHQNGVKTDNRLENLRWDTRSANALDAVRHKVGRSGQTKCNRGHDLTPPNIAAWALARGVRACLACARARARRNDMASRGVEIDLQVVSDLCYGEIMAGHSHANEAA